MAGTPLGSSSISTPPSALPPEDPTRSYDEQMEDLASQTTRKRPRLDSGADSRESMSTEESPVQQPTSPKTPNDQELTSSQPLSSRVTINMKSPPQPGVTIQDISSVQEFPRGRDGIELDSTNITIPQPEDTMMAGAQSSTAISISSSPSRSPEIEVADVEDMDQDPNTSRWRPLEDAVQEQSSADIVQVHEQFSLVDHFPKLHGNPDLRESLEETVSIIEKGTSFALQALSVSYNEFSFTDDEKLSIMIIQFLAWSSNGLLAVSTTYLKLLSKQYAKTLTAISGKIFLL